MAKPKAAVDTPPAEPVVDTPASDLPEDAPAAAPEPTPAPPPVAPAQTPAPEEPPPELSDEQVLQAMRDPRAKAILQYAYTQAGDGAEPDSPPGSPPAVPAPSGDGDFLTRMASLAEEGDVAGITKAVTAETNRAETARTTAAAEKTAVDTARRQTLASLAEVEELQNLSATHQLRLLQALQRGDGDFVREAGLVIAEKQRGASQEDSAAQAAVAGDVARAPGTPDLPPASPTVEGPPIPEGEDAKAKGGYEVLSEFFKWEDDKPK